MLAQTQKTVTIPKQLFESLMKFHEQWNQIDNDLEDFLFSKDKKFVQKMKKAKTEHTKGKLKNFSDFKKNFA